MAILKLVDKYIDRYGETVTIKVKSDKTYSDFGDIMETSSDVTGYAIYNVYSQSNEFNPESEFKDGDKTFFFKSTQTGLANGNKIVRSDSSTYEIEDVLDPGLYGSAYVYEVKVNRI